MSDVYEPGNPIQASVKTNIKKGHQERIESLNEQDILEKCDQVASLTYILNEIYERIMIDQAAMQLTCLPIIGPVFKLDFLQKTLYQRGLDDGQKTPTSGADN